MRDPTAGSAAGTPLNAQFDPMGRSDFENERAAAEAAAVRVLTPRRADSPKPQVPDWEQPDDA